jgi:hypothetical protein
VLRTLGPAERKRSSIVVLSALLAGAPRAPGAKAPGALFPYGDLANRHILLWAPLVAFQLPGSPKELDVRRVNGAG